MPDIVDYALVRRFHFQHLNRCWRLDLKSSRKARIARFHYKGELHAQSELTLEKSASHHLITVLRSRENDRIELFNGDGFNYLATIVDTGQRAAGKCAVLQLHERYQATADPTLPITLVQALSRSDRMDATVRQSVELGVSRIQPIYSRHSAKPADEKRISKKTEHWQNIIISACEQCGRACLPLLEEPLTLIQWLQTLTTPTSTTNHDAETSTTYYVLTPNTSMGLGNQLLTTTPSAVGVLIGPESGFDTDEIQACMEHGVVPVAFGERILRTETAGPACISTIQVLLGDLRQTR